MRTCNTKHQLIQFYGSKCPLCEARKDLVGVLEAQVAEVKELTQIIREKNEEIFHLKNP